MRLLQRFKGTEPVEEITEQVKAAKIEDKPKEVKTEAVDEVPVQHIFALQTVLCRDLLRPKGSTQVHQVGAEEG